MKLIRTVIVDDDREVAGVHTGFLLAYGGFEVVGVAYSGGEGLNLIRTLRPDLVLLDIHLPDMSGIEVLRAVRNLPGEQVDIIAITAARELETVRAAMAGGVLHYLVKPFGSAVLLQRLEQYLEHRRDILEHTTAHIRVLDQAKIDRLLAPRPDGGPARPTIAGGFVESALPKGLSAVTLASVETDLRGNRPGASASEVAARLGLARVSARRYLEFLVAQGKANVTQKYGAAGRPEKIYAWVGR